MFREMHKKEREINYNEAIQILKNGEYGILSTVSQEGYPYGVPVNFVLIDNSIFFHCATEGHKLENILNDNRVSFCVVGGTCVMPDRFSTKYESVIVFGKAKEVFDDEKNTALIEIIKKYSSDYIEEGKEYIKKASAKTKVIKINIEKISGKASR